MGRATGVCGGWGGSQHLHWRNFYTNGILGGTLPLAVGMALAEKRLARPTVVIAFTGDGAMGEGIVYEALNLASLWGAPLLLVVEHNHIAQTTPTSQAFAGSLAGRLAPSTSRQPSWIRVTCLKSALLLDRFLSAYGRRSVPRRSSCIQLALVRILKAMIPVPRKRWRNSAPLATRWQSMRPGWERLNSKLWKMKLNALIQIAFTQALADPPASLERRWRMTSVLEALNAGLHQAMAVNDRVVLLGEDILDPYGGAFKVTRGLSTAFPERVLASPVSEAGLVGVATGMAVRGLRPVVEIMFADFTTLIADQLINHAARLPRDVPRPGARSAGGAYTCRRAARLRPHPQPIIGKTLPGCAGLTGGRPVALWESGSVVGRMHSQAR